MALDLKLDLNQALDPGRSFVQGLGRYIADIKEGNNALHLSFFRSPYAHARVRNVEAPKLISQGIPFFRGREVNAQVKPIPIIWEAEGMKMAAQQVLAGDRVRYVGEPIAAAASPDYYSSKDLIELIEADLEPLPAVSSVEDALKKGSPILHEEFPDGTNIGLSIRRKFGDPDRAFRDPEVLIRQTFRIGRVSPSPIEPRGILADYNPSSGLLVVISSTQIPFMLRRALSISLEIREAQIRVIAPNIGGAFGGKDGISPEEILTSYAAVKLGRPVRWIEDRSENVMASVHDREQIHDVEVAATHAGIIRGLRIKILSNAGAYYRYKGARIVYLTAYMICGQYKIPSLEIESASVFTNTLPTFPYRGPGSTQAIFVIERVMDLVARRTGLDPAKVRLMNMIEADSFPYKTATGATYDSGNYQECLRLALERSKYEDFAREKNKKKKKTKKENEEACYDCGRYIGVGLGLYVDQASLGPTKLMSSLGIRQGGWERVVVRVDQTGGGITVLSGVTAIGQGIERGIAKIVARELGVREGEVAVRSGDTSLVSFGGGALASRSLSIAGAAALKASQKLREKILRIAAHVLEARRDDLILEDGKVRIRGVPGTCLTLQEIAENSYLMQDMPQGEEPGLEEAATFDPPNFTFPYGAIVAKVEVDIHTGKVRLLSMDIVHDCGRIISPPDVEGQMLGGIVQGIGEALDEEIVYDDTGQLLTGSFTDYLVPTSLEIPSCSISLHHIETPSPVNPLGAKGVGESGIVGSPVAIANAVEDALAPFGVTISRLPLGPEYIWQLVSSAQRTGRVGTGASADAAATEP